MSDVEKVEMCIEQIINTLRNKVGDVESLLVNYENKIVDDYNALYDEYQRLQSCCTDYDIREIGLKNKIKELEAKLEESKIADKIDSSKKALMESHQKELDKLKKNLHKVKENYDKYRTLYESERKKGFESKFYELQREFKKVETLIKKYNVSLKDEMGRDNHIILNYYDEECQNSGFYWILDTVHSGVLSYHENERKGFPLTENRVIDVEFVLTGSNGICLQVLFTKFGNFVIPDYIAEKPYGITLGIIKAIESKRDQYLEVLPNHVLHKQLNLLRSIKIESVYNEEHCFILKQNDILNLYDVTTLLVNLDSSMFTDIDDDLKSMFITNAIAYLNKEYYH